MAFDDKVSFQQTSAFHADVKRQVDAFFDERALSRGANTAMIAKMIFWVAFAWTAWTIYIMELVSWPGSLLVAVVTGFGFACIGFNVGHDAIHGSLSSRQWVNRLLSWSFDMMGASSYTWAVAHNQVHHTYTNIVDLDEDIEASPWMAFHPARRRWWHRYQHIHAFAFYTLTGFAWVYFKDFEQTRRIHDQRSRAVAWGTVILGKLLHITFFAIIPLLVMDLAWWKVLLGYGVMIGASGLTLAVVFQLAHCVEGTVFRDKPAERRIDDGWAEHQMRTTANFGATPLATFVCGGLDHQIEHHLFPRVCHIHYPKLAPIVRACAAAHGVPYIHNGSFPQAVLAHARTMKRIGRGEALPAAVAPGAAAVAPAIVSSAA